MKITLKDGSFKEYENSKSVIEIAQTSAKDLQEWRQQEKSTEKW